MPTELVVPARAHLDGYVDALRRGWSPDSMNPATREREIAVIEKDADMFLTSQVDREAKGPPFTLPDGSLGRRLPGYRLWIWDSEFCGSINATEALRLMLVHARGEGLPFVHITTDPDNVGSQRVIEANGGILVEPFVRAPAYGSTPALRYRVDLQPSASSASSS